MKISSSFFLITIVCFVSRGQTCYPRPDGTYQYYVNLKNDNIPNTFNKTDFINFINDPTRSSQQAQLSSAITTVSKTFPEPLSLLLARSVSVFSTNARLDTLLSPFTTKFYFYEKKCEPQEMLLQQTNDYGIVVSGGKHLDLIHADQAWDVVKGDYRIKIGITDTYIDSAHEDLKANIATVLQNSPTPNFHGTASSGCAAGVTNNNKGIASASYNCKIVFSSNWANDNEVERIAKIPGVRVINMSWLNGCSYSTTQNEQYQRIFDSLNVVLVAGAGNDTNHCGSKSAPVYPAAYPSVIAVTSIGHYNERGYIDPTYGKIFWKDCHEGIVGDTNSCHHHYPEVDICAPGYSVPTTVLNNSYDYAYGTSFASPIVASVCALVASLNPCLSASDIKTIVLNSADATMLSYPENARYSGKLGYGRLDAYNAVLWTLLLGTNFQQNVTYSSITPVVKFAQTDIQAGSNVTNSIPIGPVTVNTNANVTYQATHDIIISNNFEVQNSATFEATIVSSPCF